jgi:peptide/nickel transport system ATP-binding protein/oligopeptide transport system ATP-binding protein
MSAATETGAAPQAAERPLVELRGLKMHFPITEGILARRKIGEVKAVDGVNLTIQRGETLGLVGESGCGKTTIGRMVVRLTVPSAGSIAVEGEDFTRLSGEALRRKRQRVQMVFQDPFACLNARMTAEAIVAEPLVNFRLGDAAARRRRVRRLFDQVGLPQAFLDRLPHHMSGGQRQRLGIARALAAEPAVIVADEAVAALDVSIRSQILNLLKDLQRETGVAYLFISHDLSVVRYLADEIAVMYLGRIVEKGPVRSVFATPAHPYTQALIGAIPAPHPRDRRRRALLDGEVPSAAAQPVGCPFRTRCPLATDICSREPPPLVTVRHGHAAACHHIHQALPMTAKEQSAASPSM